MAWLGEVNKNITSSWAASVMFYTKKALLDSGWQLMSAGRGGADSPGRGSTSVVSPAGDGQPGLPNTGSGGGAGFATSTASLQRASGAGGTGIVIIRYPTSTNIVATGGIITDITVEGAPYKVHKFTASSNFVVSSGSGDVEYLIVGGGGGGGVSSGGSGGAVQQGTASVSVTSYAVVVGAGGAAAAPRSSPIAGLAGAASSALGVTAAGGAGGLSGNNGGGIGAGGANDGVVGGPGLLNNIIGFPGYYAAGGGQGLNTADPVNFGGIQGSWDVGVPNVDGSPLTFEQDPLLSVVDCDVLNAWFRIREPEKEDSADPQREFVFLKGVATNQLLIKYSRASGFTEDGFVNSCPTTGVVGDGVIVSSTTGFDSTAINSSSAATFTGAGGSFINVVVSDSPVFDVFPFYIWTYASATGVCNAIILHEGVLPGTTSVLDQDTSYRVMASGATALQFLNVGAGTIGDYWEAYGLPNAVHRRGNLGYASAWGTNQAPDTSNQDASRVFPPVSILGPSRYSGNPITAPTLVGIGGQFPKGFSTGVMFGGFTAQNVLDTFNLGSLNPRIIAHYPNAREAIFLPWVPNVVPQV